MTKEEIRQIIESARTQKSPYRGGTPPEELRYQITEVVEHFGDLDPETGVCWTGWTNPVTGEEFGWGLRAEDNYFDAIHWLAENPEFVETFE